jgi:hypothetical protein
LRKLLQLFLVFLVVWIANLLASETSANRSYDYDTLPRERDALRKKMENALAKHHPGIVLLGNSMLEKGVDPALFISQTKIKTARFSLGGSASTWWYLTLKNVIAKAPRKPKIVILFFRDHFLTDPTFRSSGKFLPSINEMLESEDKELVDRLISMGDMKKEHYWLMKNIPLMRGSDEIERKILFFIKAHLIRPLRGQSLDEIDLSVRRVFAEEKMNEELLTAAQLAAETTEDQSKYNFQKQLERSFLPHMIEVAKQEDIQLIFVRMKRRRDLEPEREPPALAEYMERMERYLRKQGAPLLDFTGETRLKKEHYAAGDHLNQKGNTLFTQLLVQRVKEIIY